jgi:hypothetical protein
MVQTVLQSSPACRIPERENHGSDIISNMRCSDEKIEYALLNKKM